MSAPNLPPPTREEVVASALNEQGFLFSQVVRDHITTAPIPQHGGRWLLSASEYPVTAADGDQTRIDLLLRHSKVHGLHLCLECKRANPNYKQWIVFDRAVGGNISEFIFETFNFQQKPIRSNDDALHAMSKRQVMIEFPIFNSYLEVAIDRQKKASYTETIEEAMIQVVRGQTGLMTKLISFQQDFHTTAIPVVVTTGQLFAAHFDTNRVALNTGTISSSDLRLEALEFCAVNFHPNDQLKTTSEFSPKVTSIEHDMQFFQTRSVFIVQAASVLKFLDWARTHLTAG